MEIEQDEKKELVEAHTWNPDERKWREIYVGADCDAPKEEKTTKTETLAFKFFKTLPKSGQSIQNTLKSVSKSQNQKNPEERRRTM